MSIYFRVFPKNGTAKPAKSWAVMGFPAISTVMAGQRGGYIGTNNTVNKNKNYTFKKINNKFLKIFFKVFRIIFYLPQCCFILKILFEKILNTLNNFLFTVNSLKIT
jgi:hypothetical protein